MRKPVQFLAACVILICCVPLLKAQVSLDELQASAAAGNVEALNEMGNRFANGQGVARNDQEAIKYYTQAADRSYAPASFNLGMMHELGRGVAKNIGQAFRYYLKAAEQGFSPAQFNVGNMYANGAGVAQDYFEAVLWFRQAADRGVVEAQYNLGLAYEAGRGVAQDDEEAQRWYRLAADQGYQRAAYNLALMLEEGRGSPVDEAGAAALYRAAAEKGFGPAQNNYGIMLAEGKGGLPVDLVEAYIWFSLAVENGVGPLGRDMVIEHLTPQQLVDADLRLAKMRGVSVEPSASDPVVSSKSKEDSQALRIQLDAFAAENARLKAAYQSLQRERADWSAQLNDATSIAAKLTAEVEMLSQQFEAKDDETTDVRIKQLTEINRRLNREVRQSTLQLSKLSRQLRLVESKVGGQPASSSTSSVDSRELVSLREEVQGLKAINTRLTAENARLAQNNASPEMLQRLQEQIEVANRAAQDATDRNTAFQQAVKKAEEEARQALAVRDELQQKLATLKSANSSDAQELSQLNAALRQTRSDLVSARRETEELRVQLMATQSELKLLARRSDERVETATSEAAKADQFSRSLEASNEKLEMKVRSLESQLAATSQASGASAEEIAQAAQRAAEADTFARNLELSNRRLHEQLEELKDSKVTLTSQLNELTKREEAQAEALVELNRKLAESDSHIAEQNSTITDLIDANVEFEARAEAIQRQLVQATKGADQNEQDTAHREELASELAERDDVLAQKNTIIANLTGAMAELGGDKEALQSRLKRVSAEADQAQKELTAAQVALAEHEQRVQMLLAQSSNESAENQALQSKVEELTLRVAALEKTKAELAQSQQTVQTLRTRLSSVQSDLKTLKAGHSGDTSDLATRLSVAEANARKYREEVQGLRSENSSRTDYENAFRASNEQVKSLRREITNLNQRMRVAESAKREIDQIREQLSAEVATLQNALAVKEREHADLFSTATQQDEAYDALRVRYESTLVQLQQQQARVNELAAANQRLESASRQPNTMSSAEKKRYEDEIDEAARVLAEKDTAVRNLTEQVASLQKDLENSRKSASAALAAQSKALDALPNARAMLLEMQTLQGEVERMESQLAQTRANSAEEVAQLADQLSLVTQTNKSLSSANRSLLNTKSSEVGLVQDELAEAHKQLTLLTDRLVDADKIISHQESNVAELTGANAELSREKEALELQLARVVADESSAQRELIAARTALSEHEQRAKMLVAQSSSESATNQALQNKVDELISLVTSLQAEQARLRSIEKLSAGQGDELAELTRRLSSGDKLIAEQNATISELTGANTDLSETKQVLELQLGRVTAEFDQAQRELAAARIALSEHEQRANMLLAQSSSDGAEKQALQNKVNELTGANEELSKEKAALQTQLARVSDQSSGALSEIDTLQKQLDEQGALAQSLTEKLDEELLSKRSLETRLADLNGELEETKARLSAATQLAKVNSSEATRETEAKIELMDQLALSQARVSALQDENNRLAGVEAARELAEQQVANLTGASEQLANAQREVVKLKAENKELDNTMRALERDRSSRIASLQQDNAALSSRLQQAQGTLDQIASAARLINPGSTNSSPQIRGGNTRGLPVARPAASPREHIVVQGDSLSRISLRYYGTSNRWQDIYEANRDVLSRENVLRPGQRLKLP